ncbi:hypothetical protein QY96_01412 [Bacillus thermotolerans]|nr:hypothetical protein QY96_01412 [Bacillus thermotolerans]
MVNTGRLIEKLLIRKGQSPLIHLVGSCLFFPNYNGVSLAVQL